MSSFSTTLLETENEKKEALSSGVKRIWIITKNAYSLVPKTVHQGVFDRWIDSDMSLRVHPNGDRSLLIWG